MTIKDHCQSSQLAACLTDDASQEERERIESHLAECPTCQLALQTEAANQETWDSAQSFLLDDEHDRLRFNSGRAEAYFRPVTDLTVPPEGTLESIFAAADLENALVPLRDAAGASAWLNEKLFARPLGNVWMQAQWPKHFDAMVFNRTMSPSTR